MKSETKGTFRILEWDEHAFSEVPGGPVLKRAHVRKQYWGDIEGEGVLEYIFTYNTPDQADIYGLERFSGRIGDKHGTLVLEHTGEFDKGVAKMIWDVLPQSGTEGLCGMIGEVRFESDMKTEYPITFHHEVAKEHHLFKRLITPSRKQD